MLKVNYDGMKLNVEVTQDAYISYQSWSPEPNNWVVINGNINSTECRLLYKWDGETDLEDLDYSNPFGIEY